MVDHLAAPRERVSMKAGNNRPFLWVRECECENCGAKLLQKKKKKKNGWTFPRVAVSSVSAVETFLVS
jgi:DNA-directed RNA polymerase subunit RPC12/RpoP